MEELLGEFISSRLNTEIERLEVEIRDTIFKLKTQEDQLRKEIKDKNDIFKSYVKTKVQIISRENKILGLLKDKISHEEIEDFIKKSSIHDLLKTSNISSSNPQNISCLKQTKQYRGKECFVKVYKLVPEDERVLDEEPDNDEAELLLQEHFGDVSRISSILDGNGNSVLDDNKDLETGNESDQAEIADDDLIEQLLKDDNEIEDDITGSSSLLDDSDLDISEEIIQKPSKKRKLKERWVLSEDSPKRKRKVKERWVLSENSQRRKSARLSLSTKPNYTLMTRKSPLSVDKVPTEKIRRASCQKCEECLRDDCLQCAYCKDKKKYGGPSRLKQKCIEKRCSNKT